MTTTSNKYISHPNFENYCGITLPNGIRVNFWLAWWMYDINPELKEVMLK